jgi:hypothetical protein
MISFRLFMMTFRRASARRACLGACFIPGLLVGQAASLGEFEQEADVGQVQKPGTTRYDPATRTYLVGGSGENMWARTDGFHFVWKRLSGDISLAADVEFPSPGGQAHRKACLLIRQGLEPDAAYADAAMHGDGLTSLQFREVQGDVTHEVQSSVSGPRRLRLERYGDVITMSVARAGEELHPSGGSCTIKFKDPVYVGLGVCAHDKNAFEEARFSNITLEAREHRATTNVVLESTLEQVAIASKDRRAVYHTRGNLEAPNWMPDGKHLLFNQRGRIYRVAVEGGKPEELDTGFATRCNNDHGISPDGAQLAISDQSQGGKSLIYLVPIGGGAPRRVTALGPSYWHGWSPDGKTLAYCAERNGEFDIYTIPAAGGDERRLTTAAGLDDGSEYSPDGQFIYFNSDRSGLMQIWRMRPDGSAQEQFTHDDYNNWFPHPSPDGKWIVVLSYAREVQGHPANQEVWLRLLPVGGGAPQVLARLFGGQGTINVPSWSPDSRRLAFVSYRLAPVETAP